jgi:DNA-directed RNA polymerase sigma subunit (sigma70/sigma32)
MNVLEERECQVVTMRYGWDGHGKRTLVEIAGVLGVSRARVSQIEQIALTKLRKQWKLSANSLPL